MLLVALDRSEPRGSDEVAASPTPAPTVMATPGPELRIPKARPVDPADPALAELVGPTNEIVRAWAVPALEGHVLLTRRDSMWCISAPDRLTDQPDIERGVTCDPTATTGISLRLGEDFVAVVLDDQAKPVLQLPDGSERMLEPVEGGLVLLRRAPSGSTIKLGAAADAFTIS